MAPGPFHWLRFTHPDFVIVPIYAETQWAEQAPIDVGPGRDQLKFEIKPKARVRGRVVLGTTGKPLAGASVGGDIESNVAEGPLAAFAIRWSHVDWADADTEGKFEIMLAPGRGRLSLAENGYVASPSHVEFDVAADGSTVAPDIVAMPMPTVHGVVLRADGRPASGAIVRFGSDLTHVQAVAADEAGRFALQPPWMPIDQTTQANKPLQTIIAYDPLAALGAQTDMALDKPETLDRVVLKLEPQESSQTLTALTGKSTYADRGASTEESQKIAAISLKGQAAPELDGVTWLNTEKPLMSLADFRDKYVLLDFWTTWCGPCHADFPSVRLLHELYKDKGLVVIGVHDNSMPLEAIQADVAKEKLTFPIVIDHADGRIIKQYGEHGLSGFPTYVLLGPDGRVIFDDMTIAGPSLRAFKIEIIRERLLAR